MGRGGLIDSLAPGEQHIEGNKRKRLQSYAGRVGVEAMLIIAQGPNAVRRNVDHRELIRKLSLPKQRRVEDEAANAHHGDTLRGRDN